MLSSEQIRRAGDPFPQHSGLWIAVAVLVVLALVSRIHVPTPAPVNAATHRQSIPQRTAEPAQPSGAAAYAWLSRAAAKNYTPLAERIPPPDGFARVALEPASFGQWLRNLPVRPAGTPVRAGNRTIVKPADAPDLAAVIDLQPGNANLLIAPCIVLRLRAEYLWSLQHLDAINFHFTNGDLFPFQRWAAGERPTVRGRNVTWSAGDPPDRSRASFAGYVETLFRYASVYSLMHDTRPVADETVQPGDVFVLPGRPGHAILVLDLATDPAGRVRALLGQGGSPAQTFHVIRAGPQGAWHELRAGEDVRIPTIGTVKLRSLRRW
ncbi:MAG: DUF4846 domain-containing protein [Phycisphaerae bacterium]|nr:DUF4846 domain-containing protein [Phycisphaerae bacterium]